MVYNIYEPVTIITAHWILLGPHNGLSALCI